MAPELLTAEQRLNLEEEIISLKKQLDDKNLLLKKFLTDEQIAILEQKSNKWSSESIILGYKLRFSLGIHGYNYLRSTNYPLPSYSTLIKRLQHFKISFGIFEALLEPLKCKVMTMEELDKECILCIDEMEISGKLDFDKNQNKFFGQTTLDASGVIGNHLTVVLVRGIRSPWKQIIACEVTGPSTKGILSKQLIQRCIHFVESCGLNVVSVSSDMGSNNRAMWVSLGVEITQNENKRNNKFQMNGHDIYITPDVCHLLKNLKNAVLNTIIYLPNALVVDEELPCNTVNGNYIIDLWNFEVDKSYELRSLHHLKRNDIEPNHYNKMNVGSAVRFFSVKTAAAIELAVSNKILPPEALTTAFFCRLIELWFSICSSKISKAGITCKNKDFKLKFLFKFIEIFQNTIINKGWKPLNTGMIMSTLSLCQITELLIQKGYKFVLLHRFTQDCIENVFSLIRRKAGASPSALQCLNSIKLITVSQFISNVKHTSYFNDSDLFLINNYSQNNSDILSSNSSQFSNVNTVSTSTSMLNSTYSLSSISSSSSNNSSDDFSNQPIPNNIFQENFPTININDLKLFNIYEINHLFNIGGSTINKLNKKVCDNCKLFLSKEPTNLTNQLYFTFLNKGGLKKPNNEVMQLLLNCEILFQRYKKFLLKNNALPIIKKIVKDINVDFPLCCDLKLKIVKHFFTVRSYIVVDFEKNLKKRKQSYGTASNKKIRN